MKLRRRYVEKPWGRTQLPAIFDAPAGHRIGEVWFTDGAELPLLAKYIFTSERLSIQVHPNDDQARARGLPRARTSAGTSSKPIPAQRSALASRRTLSREELRQSPLDGSIEQLH